MSLKKIEWTDLAIQDLYSITEYIAKDSINNANSVYEEIFNSIEDLTKFSRKGRKIPKIEEDFYREIFVSSFRIMYKIEDETIFIVAIFHMAKNFEISDLLKRK